QQLQVQEVSAILGESMRRIFIGESESPTMLLKLLGMRDVLPGVVFSAFESVDGDCRVLFQFTQCRQGSGLANFHQYMLANLPDSRAIPGLGDEALFCDGTLSVRRGDILMIVTLEPRQGWHDSERLEVMQRLAALALDLRQIPEWLREAMAYR